VKIAWFTPLARQSAIARYSRMVVEALAGRVDVHLLLPAGTSADELSTSCPILRYETERLPEVLDAFDASIFNMGDSAYHIPAYDALRCAHATLHPAIAILHDRFYFNLFHSYAAVTGDGRGFIDEVERLYGRAARERVTYLMRHGATLEELEQFPMHEPLTAVADGFIVHSRFCRVRTGLASAGNVLELFIPQEYARRVEQADELASDASIPGDRVLILTVGNGNRNKCLHLVLEALARDPALARRTHYCAAGYIPPDYREELLRYAARHHLDNVTLMGYADEHRLAWLLTRADICVNLRRPCLEGGSATLVEMLARGKALVVYDDGVYAEVPDACVRKLRPDAGAAALARALAELAGDRDARERLGRAGLEFAAREWTLERYVDCLVAHLEAQRSVWTLMGAVRAEAVRSTPEVSRLQAPMVQRAAASRLAGALSAWIS
jgi:glycosyltransferase involved in cell wall biosynthesis